VPEPPGGAHTDHDKAAALLDAALQKHISGLAKIPRPELPNRRYEKFRHMAQFFTE
jgi:acetyl-CoA carboxylase carboxyl transferase subunit alpha